MKPFWNMIFGGIIGASVSAFVAMLGLSLVATDYAFGFAALWLLPFSAFVGVLLGAELQHHVDWDQARQKSLRHWFVSETATAILLFLAYYITSIISEGYKLADIEGKPFPLIVIPLILCSFVGVVGGSVGLAIGAIVLKMRRKDVNSAK